MTKSSIEGWVHYHVPTDTTGAVIYQDPLPKNTDPNFMWRPVKITFTDEANTEVAEDIRRDRERIYSELQPHIGEDSYSETEDGDREYSVPTDRCLRGIIFGEEE